MRLSQYFKVPRSAYEEVGYLSFKGDLAFTDQDIAFFRQVKERLLAGENLDEVKSRIRGDQPLPSLSVQSNPTAATSTPPIFVPPPQTSPPVAETQRRRIAPPQPVTRREQANPRPAASQSTMQQPAKVTQRPTAPAPGSLNPIGISGLREVESPQTFQQAAERSFERYKSQHRTGLSKVFEKMLKDVGATSAKSKGTASGSSGPLGINPPKSRTQASKRAAIDDAAYGQAPIDAAAQGPFQGEFDWEQLIAQASHQPRNLNANLKNAAQILKAKALAQPEDFQNRLG